MLSDRKTNTNYAQTTATPSVTAPPGGTGVELLGYLYRLLVLKELMILSNMHDQVCFMLFQQTHQPHLSCKGEGCVKTYELAGRWWCTP